MDKWQRRFDEVHDASLTHELLVLEGAIPDGPSWGVRYALIKSPDGGVRAVQGWPPPSEQLNNLEGLWDYWADKGGGNGYNHEVAWCWTRPEYADEAVQHIEQTLRAEGHPLGASTTSEPTQQPIRASMGSDAPTVLDQADLDEVSEETEPGWSVPKDIADVLIWQVASQLIRRHPHDLWAINTFPLDGFYDCLSVVDQATMGQRVHVQLNRHGTSVAGAGPTLRQWPFYWHDQDRRTWLRHLEQQAGLEEPRGALPPSTAASLALRWIAQFMALQLASRVPWRSFGGLGPIEARPQALRESGPDDDPRFWRIGPVNTAAFIDPSIWVSVAGQLFFSDQPSVDLMSSRRPGTPISALVAQTVPRLLP
ncbi:hypothetical protein ACOCJ4_05655 [Knoellia sp. CPCC 206435]|uniref:TY-Chap2 family putative peptide chaperone n=1 Tax=Knoellia terrae TaxID=3404797 RepID=UPI003B438997